ncbi:MAG: trypsin-like peptidase domain-containing protein [Acidobacteria bacterium]|jgi:tetratricopeptide (TPR) repeat protein|nr:trypsin-like peptidase domain-containing protein [Acidobacteriota bacterium]
MSVEQAIRELKDAGFENEAELAAKAAALTDAVIAAQDNGSPELKAGFKALRSARAHQAVEMAAQFIEAVGVRRGWLLQYHAQALVERNALVPALALIRDARAAAQEEADAFTETECWSLEGRAYKQLFVTATQRRPPAARDVCEGFLRKSAAAYGFAFARLRGTPGAYFPGGNLLALCAIAQRWQIFLPLAVPANDIANEIVAGVNGQAEPAAWDVASAAEAYAHLGRWDEAKAAIRRYLDLAGGDAFAINGTLRQFEQIWGITPNEADKAEITHLLRYALMASDQGGIRLNPAQTRELLAPHTDEMLPEDAAGAQAADRALHQYEKVFGNDGPFRIDRLKTIIDFSRCVGRVMMDTVQGSDATFGTGFLLNGECVHPSLQGEVLFITNAHVISPDPADQPAMGVGDGRVRFDAANFSDAFPLDEHLWTSSPTEHDVSIFKLRQNTPRYPDLRALGGMCKMADGLPKLKQREAVESKSGVPQYRDKATTVYVIGYPLGRELSISLSDNDLIDYENVRIGTVPGPEPRRLHYRAPTEPGNSGSPVFNSRTMELIGLHHAGGLRPRLNGQGGKYNANEGLWLRPLFNAFKLAKGLN